MCIIDNKYHNILYFNIVLYVYMIEYTNSFLIDPEKEYIIFDILDEIKIKYLKSLQK